MISPLYDYQYLIYAYYEDSNQNYPLHGNPYICLTFQSFISLIIVIRKGVVLRYLRRLKYYQKYFSLQFGFTCFFKNNF